MPPVCRRFAPTPCPTPRAREMARQTRTVACLVAGDQAKSQIRRLNKTSGSNGPCHFSGSRRRHPGLVPDLSCPMSLRLPNVLSSAPPACNASPSHLSRSPCLGRLCPPRAVSRSATCSPVVRQGLPERLFALPEGAWRACCFRAPPPRTLLSSVTGRVSCGTIKPDKQILSMRGMSAHVCPVQH